MVFIIMYFKTFHSALIGHTLITTEDTKVNKVYIHRISILTQLNIRIINFYFLSF